MRLNVNQHQQSMWRYSRVQNHHTCTQHIQFIHHNHDYTPCHDLPPTSYQTVWHGFTWSFCCTSQPSMGSHVVSIFGGHDCKIIHKETPESICVSSHFLWIHTLSSFYWAKWKHCRLCHWIYSKYRYWSCSTSMTQVCKWMALACYQLLVIPY